MIPDDPNHIDRLQIRPRAYNALFGAGFLRVTQIGAVHWTELRDLPNVGPKTAHEIERAVENWFHNYRDFVCRQIEGAR